VESQLGHDVLDVALDRPFGQGEVFRDEAVREALGGQGGDLALTPGQSADFGDGRAVTADPDQGRRRV
jgi:hypothetical protein